MTTIPSQAQLVDMLNKALKSYHQRQLSTHSLKGLWSFKQAASIAPDNNEREITNRILDDLVAQLELQNKQNAELLSRRFFDGEKMLPIANSLNMSEATAYRRQGEAIGQITAILHRQEEAARQAYQARLHARLEQPTYSHLIGFDHHVETLLELLERPGPPWLIAIEGYGGVGKTSLAHRVARECIEGWRFDDIGWASARPHHFELSGQITPVSAPALTTPELVSQLLAQLAPNIDPGRFSREEAQQRLRHHLKQNRHLVVVDNLETVEDLKVLLPVLADLANPTKFLLTSRRRLDSAFNIYHFPLPELSPAETLELVRHEITSCNLKMLRSAPEASLAKIHQIVGGNPLAIRLVIGQTHVFALETILDDLIAAHSQTVDELYTFIYWRAWNALDEPTQQLFLAMPLVAGHGETLDGLAELSGLALTVVRRSLRQLVERNLVNSLGNHAHRSYTIHNLTRSFLQEQVLKWTV